MRLELSISNGGGYISTISNDGKSLVCKQVSVSEIESLATELSKNSNLYVGLTSDKSTYLVCQKDEIKQGAEQADVFNKTGKLNYQDKTTVEFSRYKQDCRKRALDLAIEQSSKISKDLSGLVSKDGEIVPYEILMEHFATPLADKYYNWLISIHEN